MRVLTTRLRWGVLYFFGRMGGTPFVFTLRVEDEESAFCIHQFLHQMKEPYKEVFTLRVFGELPFEKIAALFNKSPGWARVVFYRAKVQIKEYMEALESEQNIL